MAGRAGTWIVAAFTVAPLLAFGLLKRAPEWELYLQGKEAQRAIEAELAAALRGEGQGRERIIARWARPA